MSNALVFNQTRTTLYTTGERMPNTPRLPGFNASWHMQEEGVGDFVQKVLAI